MTKNEKPLVSIHCLVYNHEPYIRKAIDGFLMQKTDFAFEILIHDDASNDNSASIIKEYTDKHPDLIKPVYQKVNQYSKGVDVTYDFQISRALGKYIAICEGDDYWNNPMKLQMQVDFLENNPDYGLIYSDYDKLFNNSGKLQKSLFKNGESIPYTEFNDILINKPYLAPCTWLYRKEFTPNNRGNYTDWSFTILLDIARNSKIMYLNETTAVYRLLPESASHSKSVQKQFNYMKGVYKIQIEYAQKFNVANPVIDIINKRYLAEIFPYAVASKDYDTTKKAIISIWKNNNISLRYLIIVFLYTLGIGSFLLRNYFSFKRRFLDKT